MIGCLRVKLLQVSVSNHPINDLICQQLQDGFKLDGTLNATYTENTLNSCLSLNKMKVEVMIDCNPKPKYLKSSLTTFTQGAKRIKAYRYLLTLYSLQVSSTVSEQRRPGDS